MGPQSRVPPKKGGNPHAAIAGRQLRVLRRLRDLHPDMTVLQAMALFAVAYTPGITQRALYDYLGTTDSTASRTVAILSDIGGRATEPLNLIEMRVNPNDRRERQTYLTPLGQRLMDDVTLYLQATNKEDL